MLRRVSKKQLYKYLKEHWSDNGKREILAEIARRKKKNKKYGIHTHEEAVAAA